MFLAIRMRVVWLSQGTEWDPQPYACVAMQWVAWSILIATLVVCIIPLFTGELVAADPKTGDIDEKAEPFKNYYVALAFTILRYICLLALYGGMITVIYATFDYMPANGQWRPMAPAVGATVTMTIMFFVVYCGVAVLRTFAQLTGAKNPKIEGVLLASSTTMNFAPMLSILFLAARMRALQMDPVNGAPQSWAQSCFYMCAYTLMFQCIFAIAVPLVLGGKVKDGEMGGEKIEGDMEYEVENKFIGIAFCVARYIMMLSVYLGFTAVIVSIFTIEHPNGAQYTPPISPAVQCVINLCCQFFFVYLGIWACITLKDFLGWEMRRVSELMENAKGTIQFCPMLAILFVGTRMRALQLTNNKGAPQGWVQDGMYMATWAVLIQFLMVLVVGLTTAGPVQLDEDGTPKWEPSYPILVYVASALKWVTFIFLYGGIIAVIVGVYTMTPETANGRGSFPLVGDGKVPGVDVKVPGYSGLPEPVGANDLIPAGGDGYNYGSDPNKGAAPAAAQP